MAVGVGQGSQLVFTSILCHVIVLNVLLGNVLTTEARSVTSLTGNSKQSRDKATCMTQWVSIVTVNSSSTVPPHVSESLLLGVCVRLRGLDTSSSWTLSDLHTIYIAGALGGDQRAALHLKQCLGSAQSSFECTRDSPCLNGGQCAFLTTPSLSSDFICQCAPGYTGQFCATEIPRCGQNVCGEGATCKPTSGGYVCLCPPLQTGRYCQTTWISQESFSDAVSSIHQVANRQSELQNYVINVVNGSAAQVLNFLKRLERKTEASLESRFSSLRSSMEHTQRNSFEKFQLGVSGDQQAVSASNRQEMVSLRSSVADMKLKVTETVIQLQAMNRTVHQQLSLDTGVSRTQATTRPETVNQLQATNRTPTTTRPPVSSGSLFDPQKKGQYITLTNNGRTATSSLIGVTVGRTGYTTGRYQWNFLVSRIGGYVAIGVTTLPYRYSSYLNYGYTTDYSWFSDTVNHGLAASQTSSTAALSRWQSGDRLTMTLDCDQQLLTMRIHRTNEERTIRMDRHGQPLYLHVYMSGRSQVQIL